VWYAARDRHLSSSVIPPLLELLLHRADDVRCRPLHTTECESHSWCECANLVAVISTVAVFSVKYAVKLKKQLSIKHINTKEPDGSSPIDAINARACICSSLLLDMASFTLRTRGRIDQIKKYVRNTYCWYYSSFQDVMEVGLLNSSFKWTFFNQFLAGYVTTVISPTNIRDISLKNHRWAILN
jgi:hypothetical protein